MVDRDEYIPDAMVGHRSSLSRGEHEAEPLLLHTLVVGTVLRHVDDLEGRIEGFAGYNSGRRRGHVDRCNRTFRDARQGVQLECEQS